MAVNLRERFSRQGEGKSLDADFSFDPKNLASLSAYKVLHEEVDVLEQPLAVDREILLSHGSDSLQLELALCLDGPADATELLFHRLESFQREPGEGAARTLGEAIGEVGITWLWSSEDRNGVAGFVRHNVMALLQGRFDTLEQQARELDQALVRTPASNGAQVLNETLFEVGQMGVTIEVSAGGRVDLGAPRHPRDKHFFLAEGGSVNRDPKEPGQLYYRAGLRKGLRVVTAIRVGPGLLPTRQILRFNVE